MNSDKRVKRPRENIGLYFHELSKDISMRGMVKIPSEDSLWPESWKKVEYKSYKFSKKIFLVEKQFCNLDLSEENNLSKILFKRKSQRNFEFRSGKGFKISLKELSTIIYCSFAKQKQNFDNRMHPSGGGRYPLEYYFLIQNSLDIPNGIYHYNILENSLELVNDLANMAAKEKAKKIFGYEFAYFASVAIFITAVFDRTMRKYGERGYRYVLLEAGHVGQNVYLSGTALGLSVCSIVGTLDKNVEDLLYVDGKSESLVYTILAG